jgi:hypothetical protein
MSAATGIIRWESTTHPSRWGAEIAGFVLRRNRSETELGRRGGEAEIVRPGFVFTALGSAHPDEIAVAASRSSDFFSGSRICVALDQEALSNTDDAVLRNEGIGIVLDQVNSNTPLSALCFDFVEAVRFEERFVRQATADARMSCAMDALLKLAHDLGIATLANSGPHGCSSAMFEFDYVSTSTMDAELAASMAILKPDTQSLSR